MAERLGIGNLISYFPPSDMLWGSVISGASRIYVTRTAEVRLLAVKYVRACFILFF